MSQDVASRFLSLCESPGYQIGKNPLHRCVLSSRNRKFSLTQEHLGHLRYLCRHRNLPIDLFTVEAFSVVHVMGTHFRAGEWGQHPRCGSVITVVKGGRSLYARVESFLRVDGDDGQGFAIVNWFGAPVYPFRIPIVVRVNIDGSEVKRVHGTMIYISTIDPSRVIIGRDELDDSRFYMMRDSGYDTAP